MLFLLLHIGSDCYGLEAGQIVEVVPRVNLKVLPQAPPGVAGVFNYHGTLAPVLDLSDLSLGRPTTASLSTRVVLVRYPMGAAKTNILGLMAERATETVRIDPDAFSDPGVDVKEAPYLGPIAKDARGLVQWLRIEKLLPDDLRDRLFRSVEEQNGMNIAEIEALLKQTIGLDAASVGLPSIERAVQQRMTATGAKDSGLYLEKVRSSAVELQELIESVVVSETWFFRDTEAFTVLAQLVLQDWLPAHPGGQLRLLSIPCATGEEPYSMAMAMNGIGLPPESFHVDAVDISEVALARARKAIYGRNSFRGRNLEFRDRYFEARTHGYQLSDAIRRRVTFQRENLFGPEFFPGSNLFHFIFCRNLLIYFDSSAQDRAIRTLKRLLTPDGLLFVGPAEAALMLNHDLVSIKRPLAFAFRKGTGATRKPIVETRSARRKPVPVFPTSPKPRIQMKSQRIAATRPPAVAPVEKPAGDLKEMQRLADAGQLKEAVKIGEEYLKQPRPLAETHHLLGVIYDAMGNGEKAALHYRKALYLKPDHYEALMHLAYFVGNAGDDDEARHLRARAQRIKERAAHA